jgi:hypothetical protein
MTIFLIGETNIARKVAFFKAEDYINQMSVYKKEGGRAFRKVR